MKNTKILHGNCLDHLKRIDSDSIDAVVTDPPYGLSNPPDVKEVMKAWINEEEFDHSSSGFMGKEWDGFVPSPVYFEEIKRVMKPGAHALVFAGTRTVDWMGMSLRWAGFEIRDCLMWIYSSGFPKSHNISKAIDKKKGAEREVEKVTIPATDESKYWDGWGTALKPAFEPILLARKPLSESTIAENVLEWGTGAINIDDCRIETDEETRRKKGGHQDAYVGGEYDSSKYDAFQARPRQGRFPANVTLYHTRWCQENNEDWDCPPSCAVRQLDEQSGELSTGDIQEHHSNSATTGNTYGNYNERNNATWSGDTGGASRYFYTGKASKKDRTLDGEVENPHPTVKPTDLIEYLTKLITPPGGTVLDPYAGSATGGIAVDRLNGQGYDFNWIGIEQSEEYYEIAKKRLEISDKKDWERYFDLQDWQEFNGVGPKTAETLLDQLGKVAEADFSQLESVQGIGPKTATGIRDESRRI